MYSGWAKAFGLLAALSFLWYYASCYEPTLLPETTIKCYCDNAGVISILNKMQTTTISHPNDTMNDDCDIFLEIHATTHQCSPLQFNSIHILGHQDKDPKKQLNTVGQFNVKCKTQAKWYVKTQSCMSTSITTLELPTSQPHLWITGKTLCHNILPALCHTAATPTYRDYLCKKLLWTNGDANDVHWMILQMALQLYLPSNHHQLVFLIMTSSPKCISCPPSLQFPTLSFLPMGL